MNRLILFILKRLSITVFILFMISLIVFGVVKLMPGDAVDMMLSGISLQSLGNDTVTELKRELGLDLPFHMQYLNWVKNALQGDLGNSLIMKAPVAPLIFNRLKSSMLLAIPALLMMTFLGLIFGVWAAVKENSWQDNTISFVSLVFISVPSFLTGSIFIYFFAVKLNWIPAAYNAISIDDFSLLKKCSFFFSVLIFPCLTLTFENLAHLLRQTRASVIEELKSNYVRTAVLKGVLPMRVIFHHALRNSLLPFITIVAFNFGYLIGGVVVVEEVFSYPGIGNLMVMAIQFRDIPLMQGTMLVISTSYVLANLVADILYTVFNPRITF